MIKKILIVDDEPELLSALQRLIGKHYETVAANDGVEALEILKEQGPFAVIISDYKMPGMDGVKLLAAVNEINPDTVRILQTGYAEAEIAINAINEGHIFRFLTKPCPTINLLKAIKAAVEQYRLVTAEREFLEKTLKGSIKALTEITSLLSPLAFSRASRIKPYVNQIATWLGLPNVWEFEVAAMLSQIGYVTIPLEVLKKAQLEEDLTPEEKEMFSKIPEICSNLIRHIPHLENSASMIIAQNQQSYQHKKELKFKDEDRSALGGYILGMALDFDLLLSQNLTARTALQKMRSGPYLQEAVDALADLENKHGKQKVNSVKVDELNTRMVFYENVYSKNEVLLASRGDAVTESVINRLANFHSSIGVIEPIRVADRSGPRIMR